MAAQRSADTGFADRADAGRRLAEALSPYAEGEGVLVLGLPRGGAVVAYDVARRLEAPLDDFRQTTDWEVRELLARAAARGAERLGQDEVRTHSDEGRGVRGAWT